jgi:hypothetical protein
MVAAPERTDARERCAIHEDQPSVGRCEACGRPTCLDCAIPFRNRFLCESCASRELGVPQPSVPRASRRPRRPEVAAAILFAIGLLTTIPPWHRSGPLTELLSAWSAGPQPWPLIASMGALAGLGVALAPLASRTVLLRTVARTYALAGGVAAVAAVLALAASPDYTSPTLSPIAMVVMGGSAAVLGFARSRRPRP